MFIPSTIVVVVNLFEQSLARFANTIYERPHPSLGNPPHAVAYEIGLRWAITSTVDIVGSILPNRWGDYEERG